jgi:hypothetical protein
LERNQPCLHTKFFGHAELGSAKQPATSRFQSGVSHTSSAEYYGTTEDSSNDGGQSNAASTHTDNSRHPKLGNAKQPAALWFQSGVSHIHSAEHYGKTEDTSNDGGQSNAASTHTGSSRLRCVQPTELRGGTDGKRDAFREERERRFLFVTPDHDGGTHQVRGLSWADGASHNLEEWK